MLAAIEVLKLDLEIIDLMLDDSSDMKLIEDIQRQNQPLPILVFSMHDEKISAERVLGAGASGYITKGQAARTIVTAIRQNSPR